MSSKGKTMLETEVLRRDAIDSELRDLEEHRKSHGELEAALGESQEEAQQVAARMHYLERANCVLRSEMEKSRDKFDMLERGDSCCPLCDQSLGADSKEHLRGEYQAQGMEMKRRYSDHSREHKTLEGDAERIARHLTQLTSDLTVERRSVDGRLAVLRRQKAESLEAGQAIDPDGKDSEDDAVLRTKFAMVAHTLRLLPGWLLEVFEEDIYEDLLDVAKEDGLVAAWIQVGRLVVKFGLRRIHRPS